METEGFWLPIAKDRLFLDMDEGIAFFYAAVLYYALSIGDAWGDDDGGTLQHLCLPLGTLTAIGFCLLVWGATVGGFTMTENLHLSCPTKEEEIAKGGIVATINDDMQASLHEGGIETEDDGTARVIVHVVEHGGEVATVVAAVRVSEADGVVVVVIEEGALDTRAGGIIGGALSCRGMTDERSRARLLHIAGEITPTAGAGALEEKDDIADAYIHSLPHFYHAVEVIGHTDGGMEGDVTAFGGLNGGGLVPFIHYGIAKGGEADRWVAGIHVKLTKETITIPHYKGDEVYAFVVIIVAWVMGTVGHG